jgi:hypothetical protein
MHAIARQLAELDSAIRYVAISDGDDEPEMWEQNPGPDSSSSESDRYEELLVNPTLLTLAGERGDIDCGGLDYLLIRYGNFFQLVVPTSTGHVSVCLNPDVDIAEATHRVLEVLADH